MTIETFETIQPSVTIYSLRKTNQIFEDKFFRRHSREHRDRNAEGNKNTTNRAPRPARAPRVPPPYVCERSIFGVRISDGRSMHCRGGDLATSLFQHNTCIALACWLHIGRMLYSSVVRLSSCRTRAVKLRPSPVFFHHSGDKATPGTESGEESRANEKQKAMRTEVYFDSLPGNTARMY